MTDEEKIAHLEGALQMPEGKYTHEQVRAKLSQLRGGGGNAASGGTPMDLGPGSRAPETESGPELGNAPGRGVGGYPGRKFHTTTELEGDPSMQAMLAGAEGAAVAAPVAGTVGVAAPSLEPVVAGGVSNAVAAKAQGADTAGAGRAGLIGALSGIPGWASRLARQAPAATDARLQSSIDPGKGGSARKVAQALPAARQVIDDTPGLKKTLVTSADPGEKALAASDATRPLVAQNDADWDKIGKFYGGSVPIRAPHTSLTALAEKARLEGNIPLMNAATKMADNLGLLADHTGSGIPPTALRGLRNQVAAHVEALNPSGGSGTISAMNQAHADALRNALNDSVSRVAGVAGVDPAALMERSGRVASMIPVQRALDAREAAAGLGPEPGAQALAHPRLTAVKHAVGVASKVPARLDFALTNPTVQRAASAIPPGAPNLNVTPGSVGAVDPLVRSIRKRPKKEQQTNAD